MVPGLPCSPTPGLWFLAIDLRSCMKALLACSLGGLQIQVASSLQCDAFVTAGAQVWHRVSVGYLPFLMQLGGWLVPRLKDQLQVSQETPPLLFITPLFFLANTHLPATSSISYSDTQPPNLPTGGNKGSFHATMGSNLSKHSYCWRNPTAPFLASPCKPHTAAW